MACAQGADTPSWLALLDEDAPEAKETGKVCRSTCALADTGGKAKIECNLISNLSVWRVKILACNNRTMAETTFSCLSVRFFLDGVLILHVLAREKILASLLG